MGSGCCAGDSEKMPTSYDEKGSMTRPYVARKCPKM